MSARTARARTARNVPLRGLVITRVFDAPREVVWKNWTDPELVKHWWGPKDFTAPYIKIDLRVGGEYLYCMRAPDGKDYWGKGIYREIVPPERMVCTDSFADDKGNTVPASYYGFGTDFPLEVLLTLTFEEHEGKTKLTLKHSGFPPGPHMDDAQTGWNQSLDKLAEAVK
jgi:uncharacterized protein YndB with AHSA1/START domain